MSGVKGTNVERLHQLMGTETDECLIWDRGTDGRYGVVRASQRAHRLACIHAHGAPPFPGAHAAHRCGVSLCVNPRHIRWATPAENIADKERHGKKLAGDGHPMARLSSASALAIKSARGTCREVAEQYGISKSQVSRIRREENWGAA